MLGFALLLTLLVAPPEPDPEPDPEPKPDARAVYEAVSKVFTPTVLLEADYRQRADPAEGNSGFAMARARLGVELTPTNWLTAVGTVEMVDPSGPYLLDAYARFDATDWLEVTVGYSKGPLFASFRHEAAARLPMPMRSAVVNEMRVRRDVGAELRLIPKRAPIEAIVRLGNGSEDITANDNNTPTGYAALDLVLGRAWAGGQNETLGLRLGVAALLDDTEPHAGIAGSTPLGFVYAQPIPASGLRAITTGHAIVYAGSVRVVVEGAYAHEQRRDDHDGDPSTPELAQDPVETWGLTGELTWTIRGGWRQVGEGPEIAALNGGPWTGGALELAGRVDRLWIGRGAPGLLDNGGTSLSLALKWWPTRFLALTAYGDGTRFDVAPIETPARLWGWTALLRASFIWG